MVSLLYLNTGYSQPDSLLARYPVKQKPRKASGILLLTNNAFAPIPAFSFDNPAAMAFITIKNGRLKYDPDFSVGLNGVPWMWNNWLRYEIVAKPSFSLFGGFNPSLFFISSKNPEGDNLLEAHRNTTGELQGTWQKNRKQKFMLTYRYNQAIDFGTISGHFIDFSAELSNLINLKNMYLNLRPQAFYFNNEGRVDGFFVGNMVQIGHKKTPLLLAYQSIQSIWTNFLPKAKYSHNISLIYLY